MIKNLGQVAAIHISNQAPVNKKIVWVDTNENPYVFKLYDVNKWVPIATQEWTANFINGWVITLKPADEASADDYLLLNKDGENHKITVDAFVRSAIGNPLDFKGVIRKDSDFPSPETVQGGDMYVVITGNPDVTVTDPNTGQTFSDTEKIVWDTVTKNWASLGKIEIEVNLGTKYTDTAVEVTSSAGESAIINPATDSTAGIMSALLYKYLIALSNGTTIPGVTTGETPGHKHNYDDIVDRLISQQTEGDSTRNPMSQDAVTKALFKKFDKTSVVQITGAGKDVVMSQDITTKELNKRLLLSGGTMTGSIKSTIGNILLNNNGEGLIYQESANKNNYFGSALENTFLRSKGDVGLIKGSNQYKLWDSENLPDPVRQSYSLHFDIMESYVAARFFNAAVGKKAADTYIEWWQSTNEGGGGWFNFQLGSLTANGSIKSTGLITATKGVQIGSVSDVGWYNYNGDISAGLDTAKKVLTGSLLVSDSWSDRAKVPANGIYSKGIISSGDYIAANILHSTTYGNIGHTLNYGGKPYLGVGSKYPSGLLSLYRGILPKIGGEGYTWATDGTTSVTGTALELGSNKLIYIEAVQAEHSAGDNASVKEYNVWTEKDFTDPKFAYGFEYLGGVNASTTIDLNTIFNTTKGGAVTCYNSIGNLLNKPSQMLYGSVYQFGINYGNNTLQLQIAADIVHAENNSKTGRLWYRMPGSGGLATAGWKRLLTEEDDLPNILTKEKADTYYYPINGKGNLSFTTGGSPLMNNNYGLFWRDSNGDYVEAMWLSAANNLIIGKSNASTGTLNNILIRGNLKTETGLNDYLYNYYESPKFLTNLNLYASKTGIDGGWARTIRIAEQPEAATQAKWGVYGGMGTFYYSYFGVFTGNEDYDKVNTLKLYTNNATFGNKSLAVWGVESNALTRQLYNRTLTINGTGWSVVGTASGNMSTIYAPTTVGTAGQILQSNGSGAPVWADVTGLAIQNSLKTTDKKTYADPVASYVTSDARLQGIRIKLPFKGTSGKMVQFSIRFSGSYNFVDLVVFFYLYNNNGGYVYSPAVRMADGTTSVPVKIGSADDGTVYVWVGGLTDYYGVLVHDVVAAYISGDWSTGWEITTGDASVITDVRYDRTIDPPLTSVSIATISDLHSTWDKFMKAGLYTRNIGVNGSDWTFLSNVDGETTSVYAPTNAGTSGQTLLSTGGVPRWGRPFKLLGDYSENGGVVAPSEITDNLVIHRMMYANPAATGGGYCDWLLMDCYGGGDVPYVTGIGIKKSATPAAYIISAPKGNTNKTSWVRKQLATTDLLSSYLPLAGGKMTGAINASLDLIKLRYSGANNALHLVEWLSHDTNTPLSAIGAFNSTKRIYLIPDLAGYESPWDGTKGLSIEASTIKFNGSTLAKVSDITWNNLSGKPSTFTPSTHTHTLSQISDLDSSWDAVLKAAPTSTTFKPTLSTGIDWNTIFTDSNWGFYAGSGNTPYSGGSVMGISIPLVSSANYGMQFAARNNRAFFRTKEAGTIGSWNEFYHTGNKPDWTEITNKPSSFTPASHTHTLAQISDLNSSWDSILKASATSATFTPKAHNQASNTITAMTGYVKGSSQAAISTSDSLNTAIAKLEVKADSKLTTTSSSAGQATNMIVVTELPSSPAANTLYLIVEA